MTITLHAVSLNEQPLSQPITAVFDSQGGTIGRADHNTMALPDPERHISRLQAEIIPMGAGFLIKNVGGANPIVVAGRTLAQGETSPLSHRDQIRIGGYLLKVALGGPDDPRAAEVTRGRAAATGGGLPLDPRADRQGHREPISTPAAVPRPAAPPSIGGMPDFGIPLSSSNPFADLMGGAPPRGAPAVPQSPPTIDPFADLMPAPAGVAPGSRAAGASPASPQPATRLPDDFDPFAAPAPARPGPEPEQSGNTFADLLPRAGGASIDNLFGLSGPGANAGSAADPLAQFMASAPAASPTAPSPWDRPTPPAPQGVPATSGAVSTDPLALFGGTDAPPPSRAPTAPNHTPDLHAGFVAPQVAAAAPIPEPVAHSAILPTGLHWLQPAGAGASPTPSTALRPAMGQAPQADIELNLSTGSLPGPSLPVTSQASAEPDGMPASAVDALWAAFCDGAGVDARRMPPVSLGMMRDIGALLRAAVDGTLQLMAVRATTKHELRAAVTMIQARGNNPLKFSPDATTGIEQLLQPTMRGFLAGPAAMTDAMHDLVGHSIGTVAGMRAALDGMLDRFAPVELENKLVGGSLLDSVLPMNRKAKLWELYLQHFDAIKDEAQEDFHSLFGKAFLAAYEQQLQRLKRNGGGG
jgi:FHA domain-containing protein